MDSNKGQIWIETVLYTLIGLALIGLVLVIAMPKINESKDRILVEQTIDALNLWDEKISAALDSGPGNRRLISAFTMKRGELYINSSDDSIIFIIADLSKPYSEPGVPIDFGKITILSTQGQKQSSVRLALNYQNITNITYDREDNLKKFTAAAVPYSFRIDNLGNQDGSELDVIDIEEISGG